MVWEVRGADIQISPVYTAGIGEIDAKNKVISLFGSTRTNAQ